MISDDLQRIVLGNTPEGRILACVLDRVAAVEKQHKRIERAVILLAKILAEPDRIPPRIAETLVKILTEDSSDSQQGGAV